MKHAKIHAHYFRQLVHDNVVSLEYCRKNYQFIDIFTKSLSKARFIKLRMMLGIQQAKIMGGCHDDMISPLKSI